MNRFSINVSMFSFTFFPRCYSHLCKLNCFFVFLFFWHILLKLVVRGEHKCVSPFWTYTHIHTATAVEQLSEVSWLGSGLGTALPNHIAASKSSVYISNYMVACGVLEHSGRPSFHHSAVSIPAYLPHFSPLSSKILIYLFPSFLSLLLFRLTVWAEQQHSFTHQSTSFELSITGHSQLSRTVKSFLWSFSCLPPICCGSEHQHLVLHA